MKYDTIYIKRDVMFEQENKFYEENKDNLRKQYLGKEVAIVEDRVIAAYDDLGTAIRETVKTRPLGTFCIKNIPVSPVERIIALRQGARVHKISTFRRKKTPLYA
jgi:hypothetical protein